eukprot:UN09442
MDLEYGLDFGIFNENVNIAQNNNTKNTTAHRFMYSTLTKRGSHPAYDDVFTTIKQDLPILNTIDSVQFQLDLNKMFFEEGLQNTTTKRLEPPSIFYHLFYCNLDYPTGYLPPDFGSGAPIHSTSSYSSVVSTNDTRVPELGLTSQNAPIYITDSLPITSITLDTSENYRNTTLNTLRILIRDLTYTKANWSGNNDNNNNNVTIDSNNTDGDFDYPTHIDVALPLPYQHFVIKNQLMAQFNNNNNNNNNTHIHISPSDLIEYEKYNQPECQYSFILHTGTDNQQYTHYTSKNSQVGATNSEIDHVLDDHMLFTPYYYISAPHSAKLTTYRYPRYSGMTYRKLSFQLP